nr:aspartate aminotransferase family protein [Halobaculum gomorrense]
MSPGRGVGEPRPGDDTVADAEDGEGDDEVHRSADGDGSAGRGRALAEGLFLGSDAGNEAYAEAMTTARDAVLEVVGDPDGPYSGATYADLHERLDGATLPETGAPLDDVLADVRDGVLADAVYPSDEACVAHLQCPPTVPSLAAEAMLAAVNQSLDSFDQAPAATVVEERLVADLTELFDLGPDADGVLTGGGTESNHQGLLLARDRYVAETFDRSVREAGLPPEAGDMRVLCSADAHFTAAQSAALLGLGEDAVVEVPTDDRRRMDPDALRAELDRLEEAGERPFALVATAGTTDFGSVDPLAELADVADARDLWLHVDAAFGGALAVSDDHRDVLAGIGRADSLAVDFHKLFFQPIACGAFLLGDGADFRYMSRNAAYLNPEADEVPNLVGKSTRTTRRFDALKPYVAFRTLGREGLAALVDRTVALADRVAGEIRADPAFELACEPTINAVTFRYTPLRDRPDRDPGAWADRVNREARDRLFEAGRGVVARTEVDGRAHLKFTLMNPRTTVDDVRDLLVALKGHAAAVEAEGAEQTDGAGLTDREGTEATRSDRRRDGDAPPGATADATGVDR